MSSLEAVLKKLKGYKMRMNQLAALLILLFGSSQGRGNLLELATGEGKTCVIACFAALQAMSGLKVDIICSSPILAARDQQDWAAFYKEFCIESASIPLKKGNCSEKEREEAYSTIYSSNIVYGTIHDFSADVLRAEFEGKKTRGFRGFHSLIVDEVDHLTLDSCLSLTYLSHSARGLHHINALLASIWQSVTSFSPVGSGHFVVMPQFFLATIASMMNTDNNGQTLTEKDVLYDLVYKKKALPMDCYTEAAKIYAEIEAINSENPDENNNEDEKDAKTKAVQELIFSAVMAESSDSVSITLAALLGLYEIDSNIYILDQDKVPYKLVSSENQDCKNNVLVFENGVIAVLYEESRVEELVLDRINEQLKTEEDEKRLNLPSCFIPFVTALLPRFVKNPISSAYELEEGQAYTIASEEKMDNQSSLFDRIVPVNFTSTGILEKNKKYSEGVQQFLEMKHQLSVSDFTLTTNFMSNYSFYHRFKNIHGLTGTLGNLWDKKFLLDTLQLHSFKIPTAKYPAVLNYPTKVVDEDIWMNEISKVRQQ